MLVQPARNQILPRTGRIQEFFPLLHLAQLDCTRRERLFGDRRTLGQPLFKGGVLVIVQPRHGERHAAMGILLRIGSELPRQWATVAAGDGYVEIVRELGIGLQWLTATQLQHALDQRSLAVLAIEHRIKVALAPGRLALCIQIKPSGRLRLAARTVVHQLLAGAARNAFATAQIELARRVIAGMAGYAFVGEDRLDVIDIGNRFRTGQAGCERKKKQSSGLEHGHVLECDAGNSNETAPPAT